MRPQSRLLAIQKHVADLQIAINAKKWGRAADEAIMLAEQAEKLSKLAGKLHYQNEAEKAK